MTVSVRGRSNTVANATSGIVLSSNDMLSSRGAAIYGQGLSKAVNATVNKASFFLMTNNMSGIYRIAGSTVDNGTPVKRNVYAFAQPGMVLVRSATTELPAATFEFTGLAAGQYTIVGFDPDGVQNAVTYSHVTSVV